MTRMTATSNVQIVHDIYAAFNRGDIAFIVDQLTDDVKWVSHFDPIVPWGGDRSGKANVPGFFADIVNNVEVLDFQPQETIAEGDTVVTVGEFEFRANSTGRRARTRWVFSIHFRDGQVCSYEQFHDPAITEAFQ